MGTSAEDLRDRQQYIEDHFTWMNKLANYNTAVKNWIDTNVINRDNGVELTPKPKKPTKTTFYVVDGSVVQTESTVNGLVDPILPPLNPVPPKTTDQFFGSVLQDPTANDRKLDRILVILEALAKNIGLEV